MSDGMSVIYRRKDTIERFKSALDDLCQELPNEWLELAMKAISTKFTKGMIYKKNHKHKQ